MVYMHLKTCVTDHSQTFVCMVLLFGSKNEKTGPRLMPTEPHNFISTKPNNRVATTPACIMKKKDDTLGFNKILNISPVVGFQRV